MVIGTQLGMKAGIGMVPLPLDRIDGRIAWYQTGSPGRIVAILRAAARRRVPVGYEDATGFHYGAHPGDWFFTI